MAKSPWNNMTVINPIDHSDCDTISFSLYKVLKVFIIESLFDQRHLAKEFIITRLHMIEV